MAESLAETLQVLQIIPGGVWGFLAGMMSSIAVLVIANRHNLRQQRIQLAHDAREHDRERQMQLRRDVYLPASDAVVSIMSAMSKFINLDIHEEELTGVLEANGPPLQRVQMVASEETVRAVSAAQRDSAPMFMRLIAMRIPLRLRKADMDRDVEMMKRYVSETSATVALLNEPQSPDAASIARVAKLKARLSSIHQERTACLGRIETLGAEVLKQSLEYLEHVADAIGNMSAVWTPAIIAIRAELEVPEATAALTEEMATTQARMRSMALAFAEEMRQRLRDDAAVAEARRAAIAAARHSSQ